MPSYELVLLLKKMNTSELKMALKRTASEIWQIGGVIRKIENLGFRKLPYKMKGTAGCYKEANYFLYHFHSSEHQLTSLKDALQRDLQLVRQRIYFVDDPLDLKPKNKVKECDIHTEYLPVPDRPHVQKMVEISKKKNPRPFNFGVGKTCDMLK